MTHYTPKVCIGAICKNEQRFIKFFIDELLKLGFNDFIFVDTGSSDDTVKIINSFNSSRISVVQKKFSNIAFDDFRNALWSLANSQREFDYILVLDIDELLIGTTYNQLVDFLKTNDSSAFYINRFDICSWEKTTLKRLLKNKSGLWTSTVHEHFAFYEKDEVRESILNVIHLSTERIRSKTKFFQYAKLVDDEYKNNKTEFLYFKILDAFSQCDSALLYSLCNEFKSQLYTENNLFTELIIFTLLKFSFLIDDDVLKSELINISINLDCGRAVDRFNVFMSNVSSTNSDHHKKDFDFLTYLGRPTTIVFNFSNVERYIEIDNFFNIAQKSFSHLIYHRLTIKTLTDLTVRVVVVNDLLFYQQYFSGRILSDQIKFAKFCFQNNITRKTYYE